MQFAFTEEQDLIRDTARVFFEENATSERVRAAIASDAGYDADVWRQMSADMGWAGIALDERHGGAGLGWVELCILLQEQGRCLLPSPFFVTVALAAPIIERAGTPAQRKDLLGRLAAGELTIACALTGTDGRPGCEGIAAELARRADGFVLDGVADFVIHGHTADLLLIAARDPGSHGDTGVSLIALPRASAGVSIERRVMLDLTRPMSRASFERVAIGREQVLGDARSAGPALEHALQLARIALAAESLGGAERVLEMTTQHAKDRIQFGRPIGSFQAVKHRLADMMVMVEAAKSAAWYAACVADERPEELAEAAAIAKAWCSDAFFECAASAIQLHGGIGYTWEHDAHLYFKRARASSTLLGSPAWQRERLARIMGLGDAAAPAF
jgi:alkylation response protein AidB-like acyl-CoA dehydrogenase